MNQKFSMEETHAFSEELQAVIGDTWDQIMEANIMTGGDFYISSIRFVCRSQDFYNLLGRTFTTQITDEQAQNVLKFEAVVDASRHDCFQGDPRYNPDDHTFYDDAMGFIYDGYDLLPVFVNAEGHEVILDPNTDEDEMPNLLDIILCAIQQDSPKPTIVVSCGVTGAGPVGAQFRKDLMSHLVSQSDQQ